MLITATVTTYWSPPMFQVFAKDSIDIPFNFLTVSWVPLLPSGNWASESLSHFPKVMQPVRAEQGHTQVCLTPEPLPETSPQPAWVFGDEVSTWTQKVKPQGLCGPFQLQEPSLLSGRNVFLLVLCQNEISILRAISQNIGSSNYPAQKLQGGGLR